MQICSLFTKVSTINWDLPRALAEQEQLPSAPVEAESCAAVAVDLQHPLREFRVENKALCAPQNLVEQVFRQLDIFKN